MTAMTVSKFLDNFEEYFCVWTMAIMTVIVFIQVVMRYVFSNSLSWSEELARFIFLWLSWMGASYAVKERSHFRVEMFANMMLLIFLQETGQESAAMQIPMTWPYASVPIGCTLMCLRLLVEFYKLHKNGLPASSGPAAEIME
jgi:TRAP-type C4-dicarboxylate transport system permease small subunit